MKQFLYIVLFLTAILSSCTNRVIIISEDELPEDIFYYKEDIKPFTGICKITYKNGALKEEMKFENGILHGPAKSYYPDSTIKRSGSYNQGFMDGKWQYFNEEGRKIMEVHFNNDTMNGHYVSWYYTGVIKEKGIYKKNRRIGEWLVYDEAGMITEQLYY